ncbi:hypothetical protein [Paracoccus xiamenensis]|uniref:hypothetical protein n=1 Tax=Paracoccus xiamenensis TaxID=2714901 RepID=UPI00140CC76B|nr:hypothetical protein [Paracoccus xiamenensis]NHF74059.1 hypothetical protein [Paracoccus xiamenensis]
MTRMDPLTQTVTVSNVSAPPRVTPAPDAAIAPAEAISRFVPAIDRGAEISTLEAGYAAVRVRRRMTGQMAGLSDLDTRLSGAAEDLHQSRGRASVPTPEDAAAAAAEARMAELRGAAAALRVAIGGARSDVAAVLRQMQAELTAAMDALSKGREASPEGNAEAASSGAAGSGELLVGQAATLSARIGRK